MTREEAIKKFELQLLIRSNGYYDHLKAGGKQDIAEEEHLDAMQMAISALREQEERSKGCKACEMTTRWLTYKQIEYGMLRGDFINDSGGMYIIRYAGGQHSIVCDDDGAEIDIEFCPMCGRRLEEV